MGGAYGSTVKRRGAYRAFFGGVGGWTGLICFRIGKSGGDLADVVPSLRVA